MKRKESTVRQSRWGRRGLSAALLVAGSITAAAAGGLTQAVALHPAGADTPSYNSTCHGTPEGDVTFPVVTTGTLPSTVVSGAAVTVQNYGIQMTIPQSFAQAAAGGTLGAHIVTDVTTSGGSPGTQTTTIVIPPTAMPQNPPASGVVLTGTGTIGPVTPGAAPGTLTLSTSGSSSTSVTFNGAALGPYNCTNSPASEPIASASITPPPISVTSVLPNASPLAGGTTVRISGTSLGGVTAVRFGPNPSPSFTVVSDTLIAAVVPPGAAGTVDVQVSGTTGTSNLVPGDHLTYTAGPIVTGISPSGGPRSGGTSVTITGLQLGGATAVNFGTMPARVFSGSATTMTAVSPAHPAGLVDVTVSNALGNSVVSSLDQFTFGLPGYWMVASDGGLFAYGQSGFYGSMGGRPLNQPIVGMSATPDDRGYWLVASDGGIFAFGDAAFYGSTGAMQLNQPIVAMAATPDGRGYWLVASDGGLFAFGNAPFYGSMGGSPLPAPVIGLVAAPEGNGYWEVGADGSIYSFGFAGQYGSMGGHPLNAPIVAAASTPDHYGNWEAASDGGIFAFGNAAFLGSMGGQPLNQPIVGMAATDAGDGYWLVASDGGIFAFGNAAFFGSMGGQPLNAPIVGIAPA